MGLELNRFGDIRIDGASVGKVVVGILVGFLDGLLVLTEGLELGD